MRDLQSWEVPSDLKGIYTFMDTIAQRDSWKNTFYTEKCVTCIWLDPCGSVHPCMVSLHHAAAIAGIVIIAVASAGSVLCGVGPGWELSVCMGCRYVQDGWKLKVKMMSES